MRIDGTLAPQYSSLIGYLRSRCWKDPTSKFFQAQRAYLPTYSAHRVQQAVQYADLVGTEQRAQRSRRNPPELCIGVPSVQRDGISYLKSTLGSLQHGLSAEERAGLSFIVLLAHTDQKRHPDYGQPWLASMVDKLPSYQDDPERLALAKVMELNQTHAPKSKFDYSIVMEECEKTGAAYILIVEDDVEAEHTNFLYLRLFYYEGLLGWDSESWPTYLGSSLAVIAGVLWLLLLTRRYIPAARLYLTRSVFLSTTLVFMPLLILLFFAAGGNCVLPQPAGVHLMPKNACCGQGLVFPHETVADELLPLFRSNRWSQVPTDSFIEQHADATGALRWALTPVVMQHVGGRSSHGVQRGTYGVMTPSHIWNFGFEGNDAGSLAAEHLRVSNRTLNLNLSMALVDARKMTSAPHLQIFTSADVTPTASTRAFNPFPILPAELRVKIWHLALERQRIIKVRLLNRMLINGLLAQQGDIKPKTYENERYGVIVHGYQTLSKLFRVSRESRDAALSFYRVHLPCWLIKGVTRDDAMKPGILYFNPEYDFLYIRNDNNIDTGQAVDFLHDLKTIHDPRYVGLLNLAIDINGLIGGGGLCTIDPFVLDPLLKTSFTETLIQLREVFFIQAQGTGRHVLGLWRGLPPPENLVNLSFPIAAMMPTFDRLRPDPRLIGPDLGKVYVDSDPRGMLYAWGRLVYNYFGGGVIPQTEHRVLLTFAPRHNIYDYRDAEEWLQREENNWLKETSKDNQSGRVPDGGSEAAVRTAFGFWLFPVHAFGGLPENPNDGFRNEAPCPMDLKENWPDLALLNLPSRS
ncbi:hypothetical protein DL769_001562 [Monosporascus sp. CRB-8-3]|nr:hypothetical protein DL769_001562 [Monosporascus sp. CRB-8-3]